MRFLDSLSVHAGPRRLTIELADTDRIEAVEEGIRLYVPDRSYIHESSLSELIEELDPSRFIRVSATTIVNLDRVEEFTLLPTGDFTLTLRDGTTVAATAAVGDQIAAMTRR